MKNCTKVLVVIAILAFALCCSVALAASSGTCGDNLTWTLANGTLTISGKGAMDDYGYNETPWTNLEDIIRTLIIEESVSANALLKCIDNTSYIKIV